jgi:hypothetical protein
LFGKKRVLRKFERNPMSLNPYSINENPLEVPAGLRWDLAIQALDLESFPLIEDFYMDLVGEPQESLGMHLFFGSRSSEIYLALFWWRDNFEQEIQKLSEADIPLGTIEQPFDDLEPGWQLIIFEHREFVDVLEGLELCCKVFPRWCRVPLKDYQKSWSDLLDRWQDNPK